MFGHNSNIFVSISLSYDFAHGQTKNYMRPHHNWMLTVESPKYSIPINQRRDPNPTHYSVVWNDEEEQYDLQRVSPTNLGIVGSVLIQRNAPITAQKLFNQLEADLYDLPSKLDGSESPERWIRFALEALQHDKIIQTFDVEMFMNFSEAYLARRMDGDGPARIEYSRLHKDHSQKEKKHGNGFWVSYPQRPACQQRRNVYGGLM
jgi:hypothetical protein